MLSDGGFAATAGPATTATWPSIACKCQSWVSPHYLLTLPAWNLRREGERDEIGVQKAERIVTEEPSAWSGRKMSCQGDLKGT